MGLFQDQFSMLSELERLAAMVQDPVRIRELGTDQWPLAMMASGLMTSEDPSRLRQNLEIYDHFVEKTEATARQSSLSQLARFVIQRKGKGWQALLPYALREPESSIAHKAALHIATLAQPGEGDARFAGIAALSSHFLDDETASPAVLDSLLELGDMRFLPLLQPLCRMSSARMERLLSLLSPMPNRLSLTWMLATLETHPHLAEEMTSLLERIAPKAEAIIDLVLPVPIWAYEKPAPQPLHGWTRAEYFPRLRFGLEPHLSPEQLERVRTAFES